MPTLSAQPLLGPRRRLLQQVARGLWRVGGRVEVRGLEHLAQAPALLAANHLSHADPALLLALLPTPPEIAALALLRQRLAAPLFYLYGAIPLRRDAPDRAALRRILSLLAAGRQLLIFPEGRISRSGALERAREGVAYLALRSGVPVLPIAITGTEQLPGAWLRGQRPTLTVTVAPPLCFTRQPGRPGRAQRQEVTEQIMAQIAAHLPAAYQGDYAR